MFDPHLLTSQFAQEGKVGRDDCFRLNRTREERVADSGATFYVTGNPFGTPAPLMVPPGLYYIYRLGWRRLATTL